MRNEQILRRISGPTADDVLKPFNRVIHSHSGQLGTISRENRTDQKNKLPEILFISTFPPRECGIATYSQDLIRSLNNKFSNSYSIRICPLESDSENHQYTDEIKFKLNTDRHNAFTDLAAAINLDKDVRIVMVQHEFGFYQGKHVHFLNFLTALTKPVFIAFHTVLPAPDKPLLLNVRAMAAVARKVIVMTKSSANLLINDYGIEPEKIEVIPHGTHLVPHSDKELLKIKYNLSGKKVLSTFGLLSSGKNIETTLQALPEIIAGNPDTLFLIIGKTHPSVIKQEGELYRLLLEAMVLELGLSQHVQFINKYLPLPELLEYLQLTDIYLFTSKDPNQAVSGTFSYATSCGCPIISTSIPHAREVLRNDAGIIIDFENPGQLAHAVIGLLANDELRINISSNGLHRMASTAWENSAIAHANLFDQIGEGADSLRYNLPPVKLDHIKKMTTHFGMIQFSKLNQPDIESGYTLDDNARALIAFCQHFELQPGREDLHYIYVYFNFIKYCLRPDGSFFNYVNQKKLFPEQNGMTNLSDANGRAIWALGYLISLGNLLPAGLLEDAGSIMNKVLSKLTQIHSTRAMAFAIKGLYYHQVNSYNARDIELIKVLANRLVQMYRHESGPDWHWFESYLTYANSTLPEAMLCAWLATGDELYREIAGTSFDFLCSKIFHGNSISVISNNGWLFKGNKAAQVLPDNKLIGGQQPIDVAYTIIALHKFYEVFKDDRYKEKIDIAFNWYLGNNHLHQVIYNPCTGGCYDGLEENYVNLNQGAESTVSYLMARLTVEKMIIFEKMKAVEKNTFILKPKIRLLPLFTPYPFHYSKP